MGLRTKLISNAVRLEHNNCLAMSGLTFNAAARASTVNDTSLGSDGRPQVFVNGPSVSVKRFLGGMLAINAGKRLAKHHYLLKS